MWHLRQLPRFGDSVGSHRCGEPHDARWWCSVFFIAALRGGMTTMAWIRDRALTLALMGMFLLFLVGQVLTGFVGFQRRTSAAWAGRRRHGRLSCDRSSLGGTLRELGKRVSADGRLRDVHNDFLPGRIAESRRPHVMEAVDADPRVFAHLPDAPWPVKRGGWILRLYEHSLGLALFLLFLVSWIGHALGGFKAFAEDQARRGQRRAVTGRLRDVEPLLVRVVPELAERIPVGRRDGVVQGLPATALVAGIETCACAAFRDGTVKGTTMATAKSDTTPYRSTSTTFPQFAKLADDADADVVVVGRGNSRSHRRVILREGRQTLHRARTRSLCRDRLGTYQART